ncbi:MAG: PKD domain-containing protein [Anaerolineae bacterium]|nr:PKD domain-containing protein [Anaerolineae bacterium]
MLNRLSILLFVLVMGLLLPTAVSRALLPAATSATSVTSLVVPQAPDAPPYLTLLPNCGDPATDPGPVWLHVLFEEWPTNEILQLYWDGNLVRTWGTGHRASFSWHTSRIVPQQATTVTVTAVSSGGATVSQTFTIPCSQGTTAEPPVGRALYTSRSQDSDIIATSTAAVFGPDMCTHYGDPYSPLNSVWQPGFYTYHYRIRVPADYEQRAGTSIVRVELFDPDSINVDATGTFNFTRTQAAQDAGLPATDSGACIYTGFPINRKNPCLVDTGELALVANGTLSLSQVNPYWFIRLDENRGTAVSGQCGEPTSYTPSYNTATHYQLYYFQPDGSAYHRVNLAAYTGQVGDNGRDDGGHLTDRQWVSPGAAQSFDYPGPGVPVDAGSPGDFEIDLSTELPNVITDPQTGDRTIYLDVTTVSGASENAFEIWAGPPTYTSTVPGEVNARNVYALDNPGSHHAGGVIVQAIQNLPLNANYPAPVDIPLTYVGPEDAGQTLTVSSFDFDMNTGQSTVLFYFDSIAESDWSLAFGRPGIPDPDGQVRNCVPGPGCNNLWITPPYSITIPGGNPAACNYSDPQNDPNCIPFPGGRLMARVTVGYQDTYQWEVKPPTLTPTTDPTVGCAAFPITIQDSARSVTEALYDDVVAGSPIFYPQPAPPYSSFFDHRPDMPLSDAQEGDMFLVQNGDGSGGFGWLVWNQYLNADASKLAGSLTWPGNSKDYVTVATGGQEPPNPPWPHRVYGYIAYNDPWDASMNIGDWVMANIGAVNSFVVRERLSEHVDLGRVLRLPVYGNFAGVGNTLRYQMAGFALFRLAGYQLSSNGQGGSYLLLEFKGWDDSCGQLAMPVTAVTLHGRYDAVAGVAYTFTATANPTATLPITYVWQADGQTITHTGGLSDSLTFAWDSLGLQPLTVTAVNGVGSVVDGRVVNILPRTDRIPAMFGGGSQLYPQSTANLGLVKAASASVFGPSICTAYGDAYSPLNSPWAPGFYTYQHLIHIPGDYPYDTVRIELFDPDSINADGGGPFTITRTQIAVSQGLSPTLTTNCVAGEDQRKNPCKLDTGELGLVLSGTLDFEQVNPLWLVRVDENRGTATPGQCGEPANYTPAFNTQTLYELYYWQRQAGGAVIRMNLASYTGQVGDGARDNGSHLTDLQWVSPGAAQSYDYAGPGVPANPGSSTGFEINLTSQTPGIMVDPVTGDRYLSLDITAISGASENSFQIWAGPPTYLSSVPGDANGRNLFLLNNPTAHNPHGVAVYAQGALVQNWNLTGHFAELPFAQFSPEAAGQTANISLFDSDEGAEPPITFFADSLARATWSLPFAVDGQPDPDGQTRNCVPGACDHQWVTPPYQVALPENYPGGRLLVEYNGGLHDTTTWRRGTSWGQATITGPETGMANLPYTFTADASYFLFADPLTYTWETAGHAPITHVGGITDVVTLYWPDEGPQTITVTVASGFFQETLMGTHQIVLSGTAVIPPNNLQLAAPATAVVGETVPLTATVGPPNTSLPVTYTWQADGQPPFTQSGGIMDTAVYTWAEVGPKTITVTAENEAGSVTAVHSLTIEETPVIAPTSISLTGPDVTLVGEIVSFTAVVTPANITLPLTYTWQADDHSPLVHTGQITDTAVYSWTIPGPKTITVTAENTAGSVTAVHTLTIEPLLPDLTVVGAPQLVTPLPVGAGLPVSFTVTIANSGDADVDTLFFVDVFLDPTVVLTTGIPITESSGYTAVPALAAGESLTLTILAPLGFADLPPTHTVYAMVDSLDSIAESDETNNVSASLTVTDVRPLLAGVTIFGPALGLTGETYTFTAVVTPTTISDPITYTWYLDDTPTLTMTNGTAVPISLTFPLTGTFDLLVMASHGFNTVTATHTIVITDTPIVDLAVVGTPHLLTPGWIRPEQPVSFTVTIANVGNVPLTGPIQTDIFLHPAIVLSDSIPLTQSQGLVVIEGLAVGETAVLTFTIPAGFNPGPLYRQVYAMLDSLQAIAEADENNNVSPPRQIVVGMPLYLPVMLRH